MTHTTLVWPVPLGAAVTQRFGENPAAYRGLGLAGHNGVDFGVAAGTPVRAAAQGEVIRAGMDSTGYGLHVRVRHPGGAVSLYAHLSETLAQCGEAVAAGQVIGYSGSTGNSTGPHLHFELRAPGGPAGYGGAVDPLPLLEAAAAAAEAETPPPGPPPEDELILPPAGKPARRLYEVRVVAPGGLNVRAAPGLQAARTGAQPCGAVLGVYEVFPGLLDVDGQRGDWLRIDPRRSLWVCAARAGQVYAEKVEARPAPAAWFAALDAWARQQGFDGPPAPG